MMTGCGTNAEQAVLAKCTRTASPDFSVARVWNEVILGAIRRDFPAPTVHSRNLFHLSAAMWDAWAAYEPDSTGYFVRENLQSETVAEARETAMSFAAYRILHHRYAEAFGSEDTAEDIDDAMRSLCFAPDFETEDGDSPAALGNRIAAAVIEFGLSDGAREQDAYSDSSYASVNDPLVVAEPGTTMNDPNRWQPLAFESMATQNGIPQPSGLQEFVGPYWGDVTPFALDSAGADLRLDPGDPPYLGDDETDAAFKAAAVEVIRYSATLDPSAPTKIDISPAAQGGAPLGSYDGPGYPINPVTGEPYAPNVVSLGDFGRVLAEFWADGPESETPPGHWNSMANTISEHPLLVKKIGGTGPEVDPLEWDVKLYFSLNGALHDSAIAAWAIKGHYDYARPISMIRYMGGLGQSTDPDGPSYHPDGLPLVDGLVEVVTAESSAEGERHEKLNRRIGAVAILARSGNPSNPKTGVGKVEWIRAVRWVPYQRSSFVTPAFAGYVSGHSAFSRAAAQVLTGITGSEFFPGGIGEWTITADSLEFEAGPTAPVVLQWATYGDAADQAGVSRLYGGIHVRADDLPGRIIGAACGDSAWELAQSHFGDGG